MEVETQEEKCARLERMSHLQQLSLPMETDEERLSRLQQLSTLQQLRLSTETEEELEQLSSIQQLRLSAETAEERTVRLEQMSTLKRLRLSKETEEVRTARLSAAQDRIGQAEVQWDGHLPLLEQHHVQATMHAFHQEMVTIETPTCSTCVESAEGQCKEVRMPAMCP